MIVIVPLVQKDFQGAFTKVDTVRGVFFAPVMGADGGVKPQEANQMISDAVD